MSYVIQFLQHGQRILQKVVTVVFAIVIFRCAFETRETPRFRRFCFYEKYFPFDL